jgi:hypothetical protein
MGALLGTLATAAIVLVATLALLVAALGAVVGFAFGLVVVPWLMPILRFALRRLARRDPGQRLRGRHRSAPVPGVSTWSPRDQASMPAR